MSRYIVCQCGQLATRNWHYCVGCGQELPFVRTGKRPQQRSAAARWCPTCQKPRTWGYVNGKKYMPQYCHKCGTLLEKNY